MQISRQNLEKIAGYVFSIAGVILTALFVWVWNIDRTVILTRAEIESNSKTRDLLQNHLNEKVNRNSTRIDKNQRRINGSRPHGG